MQIIYQIWYKKLLLIVIYVLITPCCPANKLEWYKGIILSAHNSC